MITAVTLPFLNDLVVLFIISVAIAYLCYRLKLVPVVGFLIAGAVIGPHALGVVADTSLVNTLAEIGVILLLFTIGVEFSLESLARIRKAILVGGGLQVGLTTAAVAGLAASFGVSWEAALYTGFLVALSSTAIILELLNERRETETPTGQLSLAVLIFQDLSIIGMVLLVPMLAGTGGGGWEVTLALVTAAALIGAVILLARKFVPWLLEKIAGTRRQELFLLTVMAICFGTAALTSLAGVSLALGAFLAGLVVSESYYSEHALSEMLPLKTIFSAVFFVSVGMLLDVRILADYPLLIAGVAAGVVLLKTLITTGSLMALGYPARIGLASAVILAQIGEFSFVLERAGRSVGLHPAGMGMEGSQVFIAVSVLLMILTPFMIQGSAGTADLLSELTPMGKSKEAVPEGKAARQEPEDHVIIVGYGPAGRRLVQVLKETGIPYVVIEMNPDSVREMKADGIPAVFGDATRQYILEEAGVRSAKLLVLAINDPQATPRVTKLARHLNPLLQIITRTRYLDSVLRLEEAGSDIVVSEEMETSVRLFSHVLSAYMVPRGEIERILRELRDDDYRVLRGSIQEAHLMVLQGLDEEGLHTRSLVVREGMPAAGKSLRELELRNKYDITVLAIRRGDSTIGNPSAEDRLQPGDRLVVIAGAEQFVRAAELFRV